MKRLSVDETKKISLNILVDVHDFCVAHNIKYYLACGTLLGAIRHKGFIPWDDDIDIMMPRPDYNRFLMEYVNQKFCLYKPSEGLYYYAKVYDPSTLKYENGIDYSINKVLGVDIDIFPLDGIVNDEKIISKLHTKSKKLETYLRLANQKLLLKGPFKAMNRFLPRIFGRRRLVKMIEKNAQTYKYEDSEYVIRMRNTPNGFTGALKKDVYDDPVLKEFEGYKFFVPRDYDLWLKTFYGDYMTLPPVEKRRVHYNECYRKENDNA